MKKFYCLMRIIVPLLVPGRGFTSPDECLPRARSLLQNQKILKGSAENKDYQIWNAEKSSTRYKVLLDHTVKHPHALKMGTAVIYDDLLLHQHKESEIYYFLGGKGFTYLGRPGKERKVAVQAGTFLYIPSGVPHYTKADADNPLEFLYVFPRYTFEDIEYIFDGTLEGLEDGLLIGNITALPRPFMATFQETLVGDKQKKFSTDLLFDRIAVPKNQNVAQKTVSNTIVFIHRGHGSITLGTQKIEVKKGSYLLIPPEHHYIIGNKISQELDLFFFERNSP